MNYFYHLCLLLLFCNSPLYSSNLITENFEGPTKRIHTGGVLGEIPQSKFKDVSGWSPVEVEYSIQKKQSHEGERYMRMERFNEEGVHQFMASNIKTGPNQAIKLHFAFRAEKGVPIYVALSNGKGAADGKDYRHIWTKTHHGTGSWIIIQDLIPPLEVEDLRRVMFRLPTPSVVDIDDIRVELLNLDAYSNALNNIPDESIEPPHTPFYPVRYDLMHLGKVSLTEADVKGPYDLVFPNFSSTGLISKPEPKRSIFAKEYGAITNDDIDDAPAIQKAIEAASKMGGAVVQLEKGTYQLDLGLVIAHSGVILRGEGRRNTKLVYRRPELNARELRFVQSQEGNIVGEDWPVAVEFDHKDLKHVEILRGEKQLAKKKGYFKNHYLQSVGTHRVFEKGGSKLIKAIATYTDGQKVEATLPWPKVDPLLNHPPKQRTVQYPSAAIVLAGDEWTHRGDRFTLSDDLNRGDRKVKLQDTHHFQIGDMVIVRQKNNHALISMLKSAYNNIHPTQFFNIVNIDKNSITLDQPSRFNFRTSEGCTIETRYPIENSGVEELSIEHTSSLWSHGISLHMARNCWIENVNILNAGRNPIDDYGYRNQYRHLVLDGAQHKGGGGTGYLMISGQNSLYEHISARNLRHAPNFGLWGVGNVVRKSRFIQCDLQFHNWWTTENLVEGCTFDTSGTNGSYGYGAYLQHPESKIHGPGAGLRNVIYGNHFKSPKSGIYLGGSSPGTIVAFNTFEVETGPGAILRRQADMTFFVGNRFDLKQRGQVPIYFETKDVSQSHLLYNQAAGDFNTFTRGKTRPAIATHNTSKIGELMDHPDSLYEYLKSPGQVYLWPKTPSHLLAIKPSDLQEKMDSSSNHAVNSTQNLLSQYLPGENKFLFALSLILFVSFAFFLRSTKKGEPFNKKTTPTVSEVKSNKRLTPKISPKISSSKRTLRTKKAKSNSSKNAKVTS